MKKRWILLILPLMMMVMPVASANGWGLPEALVPLVSNTNDYDDYYHLADDYARKPANKKSSPKWDLLQGNLAEGGEKEVQHK